MTYQAIFVHPSGLPGGFDVRRKTEGQHANQETGEIMKWTSESSSGLLLAEHWAISITKKSAALPEAVRLLPLLTFRLCTELPWD